MLERVLAYLYLNGVLSVPRDIAVWMGMKTISGVMSKTGASLKSTMRRNTASCGDQRLVVWMSSPVIDVIYVE